MSTATVRLTGDALVAHANEYKELILRGEKTRTDAVMDAGYVCGNGKARYVDYYTELLNAQGIQPVADADVADADYTAMSSEKQDLYDAIHDKFGEKWDHSEIMSFMDELEDIGIEDPEDLDDAYEYEVDNTYRAEEEFAEYFVTEVLCEGLPPIVEGCVDWQAVWDTSLRYDYDTIEFDGSTYFFRNC
jgi:hypothetical protein